MLACSKTERHTWFLEETDLASPEDGQQHFDNYICVKELEYTSLACGSNRDLVSSENPTLNPTTNPDLWNEQEIRCKPCDAKR